GEAQRWTAEEKLKSRAGNAGGVGGAVNEGNSKLVGQPGGVTEVTYPPENTARLDVPSL
ncbi:MAG: hypothetical protein F6K42_08185, partial [Leptolyngbya sp. SIO1D8]|nr:hypothetical protein [Leptolyngbya sp. SIO1D8]